MSAAAIGSEPSDVQFRLTVPTPSVVTKTVHPKAKTSGGTTGKGTVYGGDNAAPSG